MVIHTYVHTYVRKEEEEKEKKYTIYKAILLPNYKINVEFVLDY